MNILKCKLVIYSNMTHVWWSDYPYAYPNQQKQRLCGGLQQIHCSIFNDQKFTSWIAIHPSIGVYGASFAFFWYAGIGG